jgi:hypothetical protein
MRGGQVHLCRAARATRRHIDQRSWQNDGRKRKVYGHFLSVPSSRRGGPTTFEQSRCACKAGSG